MAKKNRTIRSIKLSPKLTRQRGKSKCHLKIQWPLNYLTVQQIIIIIIIFAKMVIDFQTENYHYYWAVLYGCLSHIHKTLL